MAFIQYAVFPANNPIKGFNLRKQEKTPLFMVHHLKQQRPHIYGPVFNLTPPLQKSFLSTLANFN